MFIAFLPFSFAYSCKNKGFYPARAYRTNGHRFCITHFHPYTGELIKISLLQRLFPMARSMTKPSLPPHPYPISRIVLNSSHVIFFIILSPLLHCIHNRTQGLP